MELRPRRRKIADERVQPAYGQLHNIRKWLIFRGELFSSVSYSSVLGPNARRLDSGRTATRTDEQELLQGGVPTIRQVASELSDYCRAERAKNPEMDIDELAACLCVPRDDFRRWSGPEARAETAFDFYHIPGLDIAKRLKLNEHLANTYSVQLDAEVQAQCAVCQIMIIAGKSDRLFYRKLSASQIRGGPIDDEAPNARFVVRSSDKDDTRLSVCRACQKDPDRAIPEFDPIPPAVFDVPPDFRRYMAAVEMWMRTEHRNNGHGFKQIRGTTSTASVGFQQRHQEGIRGIVMSQAIPKQLENLKPDVAAGYVGRLRAAIIALMHNPKNSLRWLSARFEMTSNAQALENENATVTAMREELSGQAGEDVVQGRELVMAVPDYDLPEDAAARRSQGKQPALETVGMQENRPRGGIETLLQAQMAPAGTREQIFTSMAAAAPAKPAKDGGDDSDDNDDDGNDNGDVDGDSDENDELADEDFKTTFDRIKYNDPFRLAKLFPYLYCNSNGLWSEQHKYSFRNLSEYMRYCLLHANDNRFRTTPEWIFYLLDQKHDRMIRSANYFCGGGSYQGTNEREPPTAGEVTSGEFKSADFVPSSVPGSKAYFNMHRRTLYALRSLYRRDADVFVTLTFNPKWPEVIRMVQQLGGAYWDHPVEMAIIFKRRLDLFFQKIKDGKILRGYANHWGRIEEQKRKGGLHAHILFWVENEAALELDQLITCEMPPHSHPLRARVEKYHTHKHTEYCGGHIDPSLCRFRLPLVTISCRSIYAAR